jgi:hypothetical protein
MAFDKFKELADARGGKWVKLTDVGDSLVGELIDIDVREKRDMDGNVVLSKKSGQPRSEYKVTFRLAADQRLDADDDGIRHFAANESAQRAIDEAYKQCGKGTDLDGARIAIQLVEAPADKFSQAGYTAQIKPKAKKVAAALDDLFD